MGRIINLRAERKRAKRRQAEQEAASRRLAQGRSKAERKFDQAQSAKAMRSLDGHRIEIETGDR